MHPAVLFLLGLLCGWAVEMVIDWVYWRRRRVAAARELQLTADAERLQAENGTLRGETDRLSVQLAAQDGELVDLRRQLSAHSAQLRAQEQALGAGAAELTAAKQRLREREAALAAARELLGQRDAQIADLHEQLAHVDRELSDMGIVESGGGFFAMLRTRLAALRDQWFASDDERTNLHALLAQRQSDLAQAETRLGDVQSQLEGYEMQVASLHHEAEAIRTRAADQLAERDRIAADLSACQAERAALVQEYEAQLQMLQREQLAPLTAALADCRAERDTAQANHAALMQEYAAQRSAQAGDPAVEAALQAQLAARTEELKRTRAMLNERESDYARLSALSAAGGVTDTQARANLGMVWGVDTQVNNMLAARGVRTYDALAATQAAEIDDALTAAARFYPDNAAPVEIHAAWVDQARLAAAGDWDGLRDYQAATLPVAQKRDDIKLIWGIGPKIEQVFNAAGIYLFAQVAAAPPERLTAILEAAGPRFRISSSNLHRTWPEQARLADLGQLEALKQLQSGLTWAGSTDQSGKA